MQRRNNINMCNNTLTLTLCWTWLEFELRIELYVLQNDQQQNIFLKNFDFNLKFDDECVCRSVLEIG